MGIEQSLKHVGDFCSEITPDHTEGLVVHMSRLVQIGGKLPISKELQATVRSVTQRDTLRVEEIPLELCRDILVPMRFIALANQSFYSRGRAIIDLGTVGSLFGVSRIADKFDELGSLQPFRSAFRGRALAASAYQNTILSSLLAQRFFSCIDKVRFPPTLPFLITVSSELPYVLLAYLRPHLYAACLLDSCAHEHVPLDRFFRKIFLKTSSQIFAEISKEMGIPPAFADFVEMLTIAPWNRRGWTIPNSPQNKDIVTAAFVSQKLGALIPRFVDRQDFFAAVRGFDGRGDITKQILDNALVNVSSRFADAMQQIGLPAFRLSSYFEIYEDQIVDVDGGVSDSAVSWPSIAIRLEPMMMELKACLQALPEKDGCMRFPQALAVTMLALTRGLNFDRVVLFVGGDLDGSKALLPEFVFGRKIDKDVVFRPLEEWDQYAPHRAAFDQAQAVFHGDPLFGDDWPFVSFPLVQRGEVQAILYCDKKKEKNAPSLSTEEQLACIALGEVWQEVPDSFA